MRPPSFSEWFILDRIYCGRLVSSTAILDSAVSENVLNGVLKNILTGFKYACQALTEETVYPTTSVKSKKFISREDEWGSLNQWLPIVAFKYALLLFQDFKLIKFFVN